MARGVAESVVHEVLDPETGEKTKVDINKKQRLWKFIIWEEVWKTYPDWLDRLERVGVPMAISPVHTFRQGF